MNKPPMKPVERMLMDIFHDLYGSLKGAQHAIWTLKNHRGKHDEIMIHDLEIHIDRSFKLLKAACEAHHDENT